MMWQTAFPAPDLSAVLLLDRFPGNRHRPFWHLENLQQGLVSVTALVNTGDCSVVAFEFGYDDKDVRTIGNPDPGAVRLSYYFTKGEVIMSIGCAKAKDNPGIVIKVAQSGSR
jgi:hypothetical protein